MITGKINGIEVHVEKGTTILDAARKVNVNIPTLCKHPDLVATASCGICIVKIRGNNKMALFTDSLSSLLSLKSHIEGKNDSFYENLIINLAKDNPQVNIVLIWIPSHCGILGNEKADILAKLATSHHPDNRLLEIQIEPQECFRLIMNEINRQWIKFYQDNTTITGKHLRHIIGTPPQKSRGSKE